MNLVWDALTGPHRAFAEVKGGAARYLPACGPFAAVRDWDDEAAWQDMAALAGPGGYALVTGVGARVPSTWEVTIRDQALRMVARAVTPVDAPEAVVLGASDVPDMVDLAARARPGPFGDRTAELGTYLGIRREGRLIAMAGERFRTPGHTEISAVCTDPEFRRQGLAAALVRTLAGRIADRGDIAYLHVREINTDAARLYESLGFVTEARPHFVRARAPLPG